MTGYNTDYQLSQKCISYVSMPVLLSPNIFKCGGFCSINKRLKVRKAFQVDHTTNSPRMLPFSCDCSSYGISTAQSAVPVAAQESFLE